MMYRKNVVAVIAWDFGGYFKSVSSRTLELGGYAVWEHSVGVNDERV